MRTIGFVTSTGAVEARIDARFSGAPAVPTAKRTVLLDTGLALEAMVDRELMDELGIEPSGSRPFVNADGSVVGAASFWLEVEAGGVRRFVEAVQAAETAVGLAFFRGYRLEIEVAEGGAVSIEAT